jgi:hypothetical protein
MQRYLTIGLIAGAALAASLDADAQTRRNVYCRPRPICFNGQTSVCKLYGYGDDACTCKSWSQCFGGVRTPPALRPSARPQQRIVPPKIEIPPVR